MDTLKIPQNAPYFFRTSLLERTNISLDGIDAGFPAIGANHDLHPSHLADGNRK